MESNDVYETLEHMVNHSLEETDIQARKLVYELDKSLHTDTQRLYELKLEAGRISAKRDALLVFFEKLNDWEDDYRDWDYG